MIHTTSPQRGRRQAIVDQVKLVSVTAALTVLIWAYAARLDRGEESLPVQLEVVTPPGSDLVAEILRPAKRRATVRVRGSNAALREVRQLRESQELIIEWRLSPDVQPGLVSEQIGVVVQRHPLFADLKVLEANPETVKARVYRYVTVELPVRFQVGAYSLVGEPQVEPRTADVRVLESSWNALALDRRQLQVSLVDYLRNKPEGALLEFDAVLPNQIGGLPVTTEPGAVHVTLTLRGQTREVPLAPVVIKLAVAKDLWEVYRPEFKDPAAWRTEIVAVGPSDAIARLRANDVLGIIDVTSADVTSDGSYRIRRPEFILPPGVQLKGQPPEIEFRLVPIE
jgi:hypothetical protein